MELNTFNVICLVWIGIAVLIHIILFFVTAPFGRHSSKKWGATMDNKIAWIVMESPSLIIMFYFLFFGSNSFANFSWILFTLWIFHYLNRTLLYPNRIKATEKRMPVVIVLNAILFNLVNAGLNGYFLAEVSSIEKYSMDWIINPITILGFVLFVSGMTINWVADGILIGLRKHGETGYKIPKGFLFDYISSPNLFGEIIEWIGFAFMAWSLPALGFAIWTYANLVPRAKNHHDWYHRNFENYPKERKAVFPFIF